jgi:hypothetical protein
MQHAARLGAKPRQHALAEGLHPAFAGRTLATALTPLQKLADGGRRGVAAPLRRWRGARRLGTPDPRLALRTEGAALFTVWTGEAHRAARDVDLLGFGDPSEADLRAVFTEVLSLNMAGRWRAVQTDSLDVGSIPEDQDYGCLRILLLALVTAAKVRRAPGRT